MTSPTPAPSYSIPDGAVERAALHDAIHNTHQASQRLARGVIVVIAAAVRDILTNNHPGAPFDAVYAELREARDGSLWATGRYWTKNGEDRTFATTEGVEDPDMATYGMNEWVPYLDGSNYDTWGPFVTELPVDPSRLGRSYRFDLARAAVLDLG
ncbi:hypothetical protein ACFQ6U_18850 [Streptomyces sp. NPDC056465]|uniref:hypothetical protein n=1 Tax=Streptomyces sp. NPDC056465 TaxID=3345829 RepID=UPI0036BCD6D0